MPTRVVTMLGSGFVPLFASERTAVYLAIYASVVKTEPPNARNFRFPLERGFMGYYQLFDGQAVTGFGPLEFQSQLLWKNVDCCQLTFIRLCQLGSYIQAINTSLKPGLSATFNGFGVNITPSFPDSFQAYPDVLPTVNPESVAFKLESQAVGELFIVSENYQGAECGIDVGGGIAPDSCGGTGTPAPNMPRNCIPTPPGGGGT